jgi:hypothetical protein
MSGDDAIFDEIATDARRHLREIPFDKLGPAAKRLVSAVPHVRQTVSSTGSKLQGIDGNSTAENSAVQQPLMGLATPD